ncbi:hypothetical protein HGRIS_001867 [Hohenbuehelia grisea]|uniref:Calcineurin-like phosphoesterase domain-containing protein n=1 Tax=Hohenbuehelia grisea TaxID=104357 RepID=A0ABR3JIQ5_9AGAR
MVNALVLAALSVLSTVYACGDHDAHDHSKRAVPPKPLTPPSRALEWGDINILHTTDSHGWLLGHQKTSFPEPNYSGDLGDFSSFVTRMKEIAIVCLAFFTNVCAWNNQNDRKKMSICYLLTLVTCMTVGHPSAVLTARVTSCGLIGTGLTDGFPPGGVDAHEANQFLQQLPYDVMAIGNHELYIYANTLDMHNNFAPKLKGRYLSSNVNITIADKKGKTSSVPVGSRFAKFKTRKGRKITAFGVLFDFTGNDKNTTVQKVADMVKEKWFADAIREEPDLFLLAGHMPIARDNWPLVFDAVRAVHPSTPIIILGGHTHIRDCCAKLDRKGSKKNITFSRRYLDPNRLTYEFHSGRAKAAFDTFKGLSITRGLKALAKKFDIDFLFGTAPHDFTINQVPYPSENSLLTLFIEEASPIATAINNTRASIPKLMITNSGSQRFDIYAGPFTKNDQLTSSPFADHFLFIPNVTFSAASQVLPALNHAGADQRRSVREELERREREMYARGYVDRRYNEWLEEMDRRSGAERRAAGNLTLGYVTTDACPGIGDDTLHAPLPFHSVPDFIGSRAPNVTADAPVDLVFVDFIQTQLLGILNSVQKDKTYAVSDVQQYSPLLTSEILGVYAQQAWN